jgi:hypothetical protein
VTDSETKMPTIQLAKMTMRLRRLPTIAKALALLLPLLALGSTESLALGTKAERQACTPDAVRLCSQHFPTVGKVVSCMRANRSNLSAACRAVMTKHESPSRQNVAESSDRRSARSTRSSRSHRRDVAETRTTSRSSRSHRYETADSEPRMPRSRRHRGGFSMASMGQYMGMIQPHMGMIAPYLGNLGGLGGLGGF